MYMLLKHFDTVVHFTDMDFRLFEVLRANEHGWCWRSVSEASSPVRLGWNAAKNFSDDPMIGQNFSEYCTNASVSGGLTFHVALLQLR